jgi:MarR family transcriptional regulator, negative regulator of the multidrug operon emrRAB
MCISLNASRVQITRLLDSLELHGWIERSPSKLDRRSLDLRLTNAGKAQLQLATPIVHKAYADVWQSIGATNLSLVVDALSDINDELLCLKDAL